MRQSEFLLLVLGMFSLFQSGCGGSGDTPTQDRATTERLQQMNQFGEKLRAYVTKALDGSFNDNAQNVAIISVLFAKEVQYASGKRAADPQGMIEKKAESGERQIGLVDSNEYRKRIEGMVLNPNASVEKPGENAYNSLLGWALSEGDMKALQAIRDSAGYWASFKKNELENNGDN